MRVVLESIRRCVELELEGLEDDRSGSYTQLNSDLHIMVMRTITIIM